MSDKIMFGCDPEVFVRDKATGKFVSAYGLVEGTKEKPFKVKDGAVQVDGMALEFNTDPTDDPLEFARRVTSVYQQLSEMIPDHLELVAVPTAEFGKEYLQTQPKEALELGCDPDYNAYTGKQNPRPNGDVTFRTGAGHIHIGWTDNADVNDKEHIEVCRLVIKQLDATLGLVSLNWDSDVKRRGLYGDKGAYRVKPYGVEYRTLSNAWINHPELYEMIPKIVKDAWNKLRESYPHTLEVPEDLDVFKGKTFEEVREVMLNKNHLIPYGYSPTLSNLRKETWGEKEEAQGSPLLTERFYTIGVSEDESLLDKLEELGIRWHAGEEPRGFRGRGFLFIVWVSHQNRWTISYGKDGKHPLLDIFQFEGSIPDKVDMPEMTMKWVDPVSPAVPYFKGI